MQVYKNILLLDGVGYDCNIYLIDNEILVDSGTGIFFQEIKNEMIRLGISPKKIHTIINTHCHFDHTGGDRKFRDWLKAKIAIHRKDRRWLESGRNIIAEMFDQQAKATTVDIELDRKDTIKTKNFCFEVLSTPGHTPGSICLYEKKKRILLSGDTIFSNGVGRTDLPGGNKRDLLNSMKKLTKLRVECMLPGHGMPRTTGADFLIKQIFATL